MSWRKHTYRLAVSNRPEVRTWDVTDIQCAARKLTKCHCHGSTSEKMQGHHMESPRLNSLLHASMHTVNTTLFGLAAVCMPREAKHWALKGFFFSQSAYTDIHVAVGGVGVPQPLHLGHPCTVDVLPRPTGVPSCPGWHHGQGTKPCVTVLLWRGCFCRCVLQWRLNRGA